MADGKDRTSSRIGDRYQLEALLGVGGMGEVWRARHLALDAEVAVKFLHASLASDDAIRARFLNEAKITAQLKIRWAVQVFDYGISDEGEPYLVMELLDGETLAARLRRERKLGALEVVRFVGQAARALDRAHALGIVHRDFKPENLFVVKDDEGGEQIKVVDFGIAKLRFAEKAAPDSRRSGKNEVAPVALTSAGTRIGTPYYMAPEQVEARADVGPAADVWALGVVAFECLTGRRPFEAPDTAMLFGAIREGKHLPARSLDSALPVAFDEWFERACARTADARFSSAREAAHALAVALGAPEPADAGRSDATSRFPPAAAGAREATATAETELDTSAASMVARTDAPLAEARAARRGTRLSAGLLAVGLVLGAAGLLGWRALRAKEAARVASVSSGAPEPAASAVPFRPEHPRRVTFGERCEEFPVFSPDGRTLFFSATSSTAVETLEAMGLPDGSVTVITDGAQDLAPAPSPDGKQLAFVRFDASGVGTWLMDLPAGKPHLLHPGAARPSWTRDGAAVWSGDLREMALVDRGDGHVLRTLPHPAESCVSHVIEQPDGSLLFNALYIGSTRHGGIGVYGAADGATHWLFEGRTDEVLAPTPDGRFVLASAEQPSGTIELMAVPREGGAPMSLAAVGIKTPRKGLAFSPDGRTVAWSTCRGIADLADLDDSGKVSSLNAETTWYDSAVAAVPGGTSAVIISDRGGDDALWVVDLRGSVQPRVLSTPGLEPVDLAVSPDGKSVAVAARGKGIWLLPVDGAEAPRQLVSGDARGPTFLTGGPGGLSVGYWSVPEGGVAVTKTVPLSGGSERPLLGTGTSGVVGAPPGSGARFAYFQVDPKKGDALLPMVSEDGGKGHPLSRELEKAAYGKLAFSPDGRRAALTMSNRWLLEVDVASGALLRRVDAHASIRYVAYAGGGIVVVRSLSVGDVWMADVGQ